MAIERDLTAISLKQAANHPLATNGANQSGVTLHLLLILFHSDISPDSSYVQCYTFLRSHEKTDTSPSALSLESEESLC